MTKHDVKFKVGDRVKRSDADSSCIPAYRNMRGTVKGFDHGVVIVLWDCDEHCTATVKTSMYRPEYLKLVEHR